MLTVLADFEIEPLGESALVIDAGDQAVGLSAFLEGLNWEEMVDVVPAFDRVAVYFRGIAPSPEVVSLALSDFAPASESPRKNHVVPVCYELGEDLNVVLDRLSISKSEFVCLHAGQVFDCKAIGFCPGFPYLGWLNDRIGSLGRLESPRLRVPPGSVAIAGRMTGVYTLPRPGGWWLVGKTPLTLVDPEEDYFPIQVGDTVEFVEIGTSEYEQELGERL